MRENAPHDDDGADEDFGFSPEFFGFDPAEETADDVDADDAAFAATLFASALTDEPAITDRTSALIAAARTAADRPEPVDQLALRRRQRRKNWVTGVLVAAAVGAVAVIAGPKLFGGTAQNTADSAVSAAATSAAASMGAPEYVTGDSDSAAGGAAAGTSSEAAAPAPVAGGTSAGSASSAAESSAASGESGPSSAAASSAAATAATSTQAADSGGVRAPVATAVPESPSAGATVPTTIASSTCSWKLLPADAVRAAGAAVGIPAAATHRAVVGDCQEHRVGGVQIPAVGSTPGLTVTVVRGTPGACVDSGSCVRPTGTAGPRYSYQRAAGGVVVYDDGLEVTVVADAPAGVTVTQDELAAAGRAVLAALR